MPSILTAEPRIHSQLQLTSMLFPASMRVGFDPPWGNLGARHLMDAVSTNLFAPLLGLQVSVKHSGKAFRRRPLGAAVARPCGLRAPAALPWYRKVSTSNE
jgi:hypothetical protein